MRASKRDVESTYINTSEGQNDGSDRELVRVDDGCEDITCEVYVLGSEVR